MALTGLDKNGNNREMKIRRKMRKAGGERGKFKLFFGIGLKKKGVQESGGKLRYLEVDEKTVKIITELDKMEITENKKKRRKMRKAGGERGRIKLFFGISEK